MLGDKGKSSAQYYHTTDLSSICFSVMASWGRMETLSSMLGIWCLILCVSDAGLSRRYNDRVRVVLVSGMMYSFCVITLHSQLYSEIHSNTNLSYGQHIDLSFTFKSVFMCRFSIDASKIELSYTAKHDNNTSTCTEKWQKKPHYAYLALVCESRCMAIRRSWKPIRSLPGITGGQNVHICY